MSDTSKSLPDMQQTEDIRGIDIDRVGVENIDFPMFLQTKLGNAVLIYTRVNMYTSLHNAKKGIHMSRFAEILMKHRYTILNQSSMKLILEELQEKMDNVKDTYINVSFKYFLPCIAPISKQESVLAHDCRFISKLQGNEFTFQFEVNIIATSCCPCSKELSLEVGGAHNQRSLITVRVEPSVEKELWIEDLIPLIEEAGSCPVYPLLKRVDEKFVTEKAYENPKFVEDISRDIAVILEELPITFYKIRVCNQESIHTHDAVAYISRQKVQGKWVEEA